MTTSCLAATLGSVALLGVGLSSPIRTAPLAFAAESNPNPTLHADTIFSAQDLQADLVILRRACETLHPGLHRYKIGPDLLVTPTVRDIAEGRDSEMASVRGLIKDKTR